MLSHILLMLHDHVFSSAVSRQVLQQSFFLVHFQVDFNILYSCLTNCNTWLVALLGVWTVSNQNLCQHPAKTLSIKCKLLKPWTYNIVLYISKSVIVRIIKKRLMWQISTWVFCAVNSSQTISELYLSEVWVCQSMWVHRCGWVDVLTVS